MKITEEKEQQKAIKEQMIEEEKVRREIDREKKRIDKLMSGETISLLLLVFVCRKYLAYKTSITANSLFVNR
ncbi:hypothetical protein [Enterococcus faecium]|nr:hypothetical protein [Enterococcus faecium]BDP96435.1 hypothetical protein EfmGK961_02510 [Enterococcus faecium]